MSCRIQWARSRWPAMPRPRLPPAGRSRFRRDADRRRLPAARHIALVGEQRFRRELPPLPAQPLYVDPARGPAARWRFASATHRMIIRATEAHAAALRQSMPLLSHHAKHGAPMRSASSWRSRAASACSTHAGGCCSAAPSATRRRCSPWRWPRPCAAGESRSALLRERQAAGRRARVRHHVPRSRHRQYGRTGALSSRGIRRGQPPPPLLCRRVRCHCDACDAIMIIRYDCPPRRSSSVATPSESRSSERTSCPCSRAVRGTLRNGSSPRSRTRST